MFNTHFPIETYVEDFVQTLRTSCENLTKEEALTLSMMDLAISNFVEEKRKTRSRRTDGAFQWPEKYPYVAVKVDRDAKDTFRKIENVLWYDFNINDAYHISVSISHIDEDSNDFLISILYQETKEIRYFFRNK